MRASAWARLTTQVQLLLTLLHTSAPLVRLDLLDLLLWVWMVQSLLQVCQSYMCILYSMFISSFKEMLRQHTEHCVLTCARTVCVFFAGTH
jgi:hypothetical protein